MTHEILAGAISTILKQSADFLAINKMLKVRPNMESQVLRGHLSLQSSKPIKPRVLRKATRCSLGGLLHTVVSSVRWEQVETCPGWDTSLSSSPCFQYSWFFFEILVKSMALYLLDENKIKVRTEAHPGKLLQTSHVGLVGMQGV